MPVLPHIPTCDSLSVIFLLSSNQTSNNNTYLTQSSPQPRTEVDFLMTSFWFALNKKSVAYPEVTNTIFSLPIHQKAYQLMFVNFCNYLFASIFPYIIFSPVLLAHANRADSPRGGSSGPECRLCDPRASLDGGQRDSDVLERCAHAEGDAFNVLTHGGQSRVTVEVGDMRNNIRVM